MGGDNFNFSAWIGNRESAEDDITIQAVAAMSATLDRDDPAPLIGDPLPTLWHWMYFSPKVRRSGLGPDGHPERGGYLPPVPLPRRMFAGARYTFHTPIRIGTRVSRTSESLDVTSKHGKSGQLVFVKVRHIYSMGTEIVLEEELDIFYREVDASTGTPTGCNTSRDRPGCMA